jgi:hypothetical protein
MPSQYTNTEDTEYDTCGTANEAADAATDADGINANAYCIAYSD